MILRKSQLVCSKFSEIFSRRFAQNQFLSRETRDLLKIPSRDLLKILSKFQSELTTPKSRFA